MPTPPPARRLTIASALAALAGVALFVWLVRSVGVAQIWQGFRQIGWGLLAIVVLGGLRFAARALAWTIALDPPHRLRFRDAFNAVVCGDTLGNVMTLGPLVSEAAKLALVRSRVPLGPAFTALAIENLLYTLSVAAMIAAATVALLFSFDLPDWLREFSEVALAGVAVLFAVTGWMFWRRPALVGSIPALFRPGESSRLHGRLEKVRAVEHEIYSFASRRPGAVLPAIAAELSFHALGVLEVHLTLWLITGAPPPLLIAFIVEGFNRLIAVAFKIVPFQVGVGEGVTGWLTAVLGLGTAPGVTVSLARKVRMVIWSGVGTALLVRQGLSAQALLKDAELTADARPDV